MADGEQEQQPERDGRTNDPAGYRERMEREDTQTLLHGLRGLAVAVRECLADWRNLAADLEGFAGRMEVVVDVLRARGVAVERAAEAPKPSGLGMPARLKAMLEEGMAYKEIAAALNAEGIRTRRGTAWDYIAVYQAAKRGGLRKRDLHE